MMILIKEGKVVANAKREQNFILDLAALGKVMAVMTKGMAIIKQG